MALKFKTKGASEDALTQLIKLSKLRQLRQESKRIRHSNDMTTYRRMMASADSLVEFNNLLSLLNDDISRSGGENFEGYSNIGIDIAQKKDALIIARGLPRRIDSVKAEWANKNFEELTLDDVKKLKSDFTSINDDYNNVAYNFTKNGVIPPSILSLSSINNMNFINDSYDAGIVDLMKTGKFTPDDWMILQNVPEQLEDIRKLRLDENERIYNKYAPILNDLNRVNQDELDVALNSSTITPLLEPFVKDAITGEVNELEQSTLRKAIESGDRLGLTEFTNRKRNEVKQIVTNASEQLRFWGEKDQVFTGDETTDDKNKIFNSLFNSDSVSIQESYLSDGKYFTDNLGIVHEVAKNEDNTYRLLTSKPDKQISINNANNLPEIAASLWNNLDEYAGNISLKDEDENVLKDRGLERWVQDNIGGHSVITFMKELKKLDKTLKGSKSKIIEYKNEEGKFVQYDLGREWDGAKNIEDFKRLSEILKSERYKINGMWANNTYFKGFKNLESRLFSTNATK